MPQLTEAGRKMIGKYLEHKAYVETSKRTPSFDARQRYTDKQGRIFMTLAPGDGPGASTLRKLVRDGFAEGVFNWCGNNRWMIPTEAGLAAFHAEKVSA